MDNSSRIEILLVEDSETDGKLVLRALQRHGITNNSLWVKDGAEALDWLLRKGAYLQWPADTLPRLIILDLKLPKMDGIQVLDHIKSNERTRTIPVVMMSSSVEEVDLRRAYERSVNSYVVKPMDFAEFSRVLVEVCSYWLTVNQLPALHNGHAVDA